MSRRIKKFIAKVYISNEAKKDQPNLINCLKNKFAGKIRDKGYLPTTNVLFKEDFNFESGELLSYFVCRAIYVGRKKSSDKSLEKRFKEHYRNRIVKW